MKEIKSQQNNYKIVPLSKELIDDAMLLMELVFPFKQDQKDAKWSFGDSLSRLNSNKQYWLAVNSEDKVAGITGLYNDNKDNNIVWLGWFGVHPQHRRHGLGSMLLSFAISKAKERGFSTLKLYSSFDENERASHILYRKYGFIEIMSDEKADKIVFLKELR
jgi:GNAT superfamily N-acetyltransferase